MNTSTFGEKIRQLREDRNMLLRELAAGLQMDTALLSKIERGERKARKEHLKQFADILETSEEELLTLWLADQVYDMLKNDENAEAALRVAEDKIKYGQKS